MKAIRHILSALALCLAMGMSAQPVTIHGIVKDAGSRKVLESVNVSLAGSHIGTVTNHDGFFALKIPADKFPATIEFSHLSYGPQHIVVTSEADAIAGVHTVYLRVAAARMGEIVVTGMDGESLIKDAVERIDKNCPDFPTMLSTFYRETIQKKKRYISVSEAVLNVYKPPYSQGDGAQRVQVLKGRKLISPVASDTLSVKLMGGPTQAASLDYLISRWPLFERDNLAWYSYRVEGYNIIEGRPHYRISFTPKVTMEFAMLGGVCYIDKETLAIDRIEATTLMNDEYKVSRQILRKKPSGMRFKPQEISCVVNFKTIDGTTYLSYIRSTIRFQCDWKRRLFHTGYTVIAESVVTDRVNNPVHGISWRDAFRDTSILPDKIEYFNDSAFWKDYNIIEPTESLENAVTKLKKSYSKVQP